MQPESAIQRPAAVAMRVLPKVNAFLRSFRSVGDGSNHVRGCEKLNAGIYVIRFAAAGNLR